MENTKSERNSSVELLRILAGMAVVVLHFNYFPSGGGAIGYSSGITKEILMLLEVICICAVNVFVLISGYFNLYTKLINISKLLKILVQTCLFSFIFCLISCFLNKQFSAQQIITSLLPVNYYVILYVSVMIIAPFFNMIVYKMKEKDVNRLVIILFSLFSIYPTIVDVMEECFQRKFNGLSSISITGSCSGYSIVNFALVYMIGAILRRTNFISKVKKRQIIVFYGVCIVIIFCWRKFLPDTALMYSNPFIIIESTLIFTLFAKINIKNKTINEIAPASFTCYLLHGQILKKIDYKLLGYWSPIKLFSFLILVILVVYMISYLVMKLWNFLMSFFYKRTIDKIPSVSIISLDESEK